MTAYWQDGLICMTPASNIRAEWDAFIATLGEDGLRTLRAAGIDPHDPMEVADKRFHRTVDTCEGDNSSDSKRSSYFEKVTKKELVQDYLTQRDVEDPLTVFSIQIARMVVEAFDCSKSTEVRFHCDCIRLALGDASMGSQKAVCDRYNVSKATLSWHVRKIQKRLNLPKCIFNGNRTKA